MLLSFIPPPYRPIALLVIGAVVAVVGIVTASRVPIVIGAVLLAWGVVRGVGRLRHGGEFDQNHLPRR